MQTKMKVLNHSVILIAPNIDAGCCIMRLPSHSRFLAQTLCCQSREVTVSCVWNLWFPLSVWLSMLVSINAVTLRRARLVSGWVTVFGRVNHLGAEPGTQVYTVTQPEPSIRWSAASVYPAKTGELNKHIGWYTSPYPWYCSIGWCLTEGLGNGDQRRRTGIRCVFATLRYTNPHLLYLLNLTHQRLKNAFDPCACCENYTVSEWQVDPIEHRHSF